MSKYNKSSKKFHHKKSQSMDDSFLDRMQPKNTVVARTHISTGSLESSLNVSSFRDESLNESNILPNRNLGSKEDPSILLNNTQDIIFVDLDRSERTKRSDERRGLLSPEEDYFDLLTDKEKNMEEFQGFIFEVVFIKLPKEGSLI